MTKANFNRFDDINHTPLRAYNRVVLMSNLMADFGKEVSAEYAGLFDDNERKQMFVVQAYLKQHGPEETRKAVTKHLEVAYDAGDTNDG